MKCEDCCIGICYDDFGAGELVFKSEIIDNSYSLSTVFLFNYCPYCGSANTLNSIFLGQAKSAPKK